MKTWALNLRLRNRSGYGLSNYLGRYAMKGIYAAEYMYIFVYLNFKKCFSGRNLVDV